MFKTSEKCIIWVTIETGSTKNFLFLTDHCNVDPSNSTHKSTRHFLWSFLLLWLNTIGAWFPISTLTKMKTEATAEVKEKKNPSVEGNKANLLELHCSPHGDS